MARLLHTVLALTLSSSLVAFAGDDSAHWSYQGHGGPAHWGELEAEFALCASGRNQSPVDLKATMRADLPPLQQSYRLESREILNNGHTVQVNFAAGSTLSVNGRSFELKQVHFHTPSENHVDGKPFAAEAHFVHADASGNLAVVAVLFEQGAENAAIAAIERAAPSEAGRHASFGDGGQLAGLLPSRRDYYEFSGSLTTPPCSEGVLWLVLKQPMSLSTAQLATLTKLVHGPNNRPLQDLNARLVLN